MNTPHDPTDVVRIDVVACGHIGRRHLRVIREEPRAVLVGFCDSDPAVVERTARDYPGTKRYATLPELLADADVDLVSVCTPHGLHAEMSIAARYASRGTRS